MTSRCPSRSTRFERSRPRCREAAVHAEPEKFSLPSESDMRFNWIHVNLEAIDHEEMRDLVENAWSRCVPKYVAKGYAEAQGYV